MAIAPERAGLSCQWKLGNPLRKPGIVEMPVEELSLRIELFHPAADIVSGDPRGLQEQIPDRRLPLGRDEFVWLAIRIAFLNYHLHIRKGRNVFRNRIIERKFPRINQQHRREARDRLGHRTKSKNRFRCHYTVGPDVAHPKSLQVNRVAMLLYQDDG